MYGHLYIESVGHREAVVDRSRSGAPVLVQLEPHGAGSDLLFQRRRQAGVAFAQITKIHRQCLRGFQHAVYIPGARRAGGGVGACGGTGASAQHGGYA